MDKAKYQYEGVKWLYEMEMLNHPQLINQIKLNILMVSNRIKEAELLIYRENKSMLVLLELSWFGRRSWIKKQIFASVHDILSQLLPSFRFRVTDDPKIMEMAIAQIKRALTGGLNENASLVRPTESVPNDQPANGPSTGPSADQTGEPASIQSSEANTEEQPKDEPIPRKGTGQSDSSEG